MSLPDGNANEDDSQLVASILEGDVNAYSTLVLRYQGAIFNLMYRMTDSYEDAGDLAQETFIKAYEQLHRFQRGKKFFPWLYTIGLNHARNFLRHNKRMQWVSLEDCEIGSELDYPGQQEDKICASLDCGQLREALNQLPVEYREAVMLRYNEGLSMDEVAEAMTLKLS